MSNPVAVAFEKAEIAQKVFNDHINYVLNNIDAEWNWPEVNRLAKIANNADRELEAVRHTALNECSCLPDLPDGRVNGGRGTLCPVCTADSADNDEIPFGGDA